MDSKDRKDCPNCFGSGQEQKPDARKAFHDTVECPVCFGTGKVSKNPSPREERHIRRTMYDL